MENFDYIVIGSGPAGVACAKALIDSGKKVRMLDIGKTLESNSQKLDHSVFGKSSSGFPIKLSFGSSFPYSKKPIEQHGTQCLESEAKGGFTNVWGAAILPPEPNDLEDWPISYTDLEPCLAECEKLLSPAQSDDGLSELYSVFNKGQKNLNLSTQAKNVLNSLEKSSLSLKKKGIFFGKARLAVKETACVYCGNCLSGCPYQAIYNSAHTLENLQKTKKLEYVSGVEVTAVEETVDDNINVYAVNGTYSAKKVFLSAGVLPSLRIIAASLPFEKIERRISFHPYFLIPILFLKSAKGVLRENLHTLSQLFIELPNTKNFSRTHLQLYTYNNLFKEKIENHLRYLGPFRHFFASIILNRMGVIQAYFPSKAATQITAMATNNKLELSGYLGPDTKSKMSKVTEYLFLNFRKLGFFTMPNVFKAGSPGDGNHIAGSFPMRLNPTHLETDKLGQLYFQNNGKLNNWKNIHIVDASTFPNIPTATITFLSMANAYRIAKTIATRND